MYRYDSYKPENAFLMNTTDKDYNFRFRENIFRKNDHFFDLPPKMLKE
jgi:hypothetical protein